MTSRVYDSSSKVNSEYPKVILFPNADKTDGQKSEMSQVQHHIGLRKPSPIYVL